MIHRIERRVQSEQAAPATAPRHVGKTLASDAAVLVALLITLELVLRFAAPGYGRHLFDDQFTGGFPLERTPDGFRGTTPPKSKEPRELRVISIGDSVTMGTGVPASATFAHALGPQVADLTSRPVTTINAGVEGWGLKQLKEAFDDRWSGYAPDVVVLFVSGNMVSRAWIERGKVMTAADATVRVPTEPSNLGALRVRANRLAKKLYSPSFLMQRLQGTLYAIGLLDHNIHPSAPYGALLAHGWRQIGLDPAVVDEAWAQFDMDLRSLYDAARTHGATVLVTTVPARFMLSDGAWDNEKFVSRQRIAVNPVEHVRSVSAFMGAAYVDSTAALSAARARDPGAPLYIQFDYTHLDAEGHAAVAAALATHIAKQR